MELVSGSKVDDSPLQSTARKSIPFREPEDPIHGGLEACRLLYANHEVEVKRYREPPTRATRNVRVTKVISPYMFFTEFDYPTPVRGFKDWRWAMQEFYNDREKSVHYKVNSSILLKYRCYAFHDPETNLWERVRVMKYDVETQLAEVYIFEFNEFRIVDKSSIMELNPDFSTWSAQGFPSHLLNIQPIGGSGYWPKDAVDHFRKLVEGKSFTSIIICRTEVDFPEGFPDIVEYFGVAMIQRDPPAFRTLQAEMVKAGFAEATGNFGGYEEILIDGGGMVGRFALEQYDKECPQSFIVPGYSYTSQPSAYMVRQMLAKLLAKAQIVRNSCATETARQLEFTPDILGKHSKEDQSLTNPLPDLFKAAVCQIRFSHVASPSILYVQLEKNVDELREMETAIALLVQDEEPVSFDKGVAGTTITGLIQVDRNREPVWARGVVRHPLPAVKLFKVVLVDYGTEVSLKQESSRYLPPYFQRIPGFAHRVYMDSTMLVPTAGQQWSNIAASTFRKYMSAWNQQIPVYYLWSPPSASVIQLDDFNQDVQWNPVSHKWEASPIKISILNNTINSMRDNPLLTNMYRAVGVDIVYELMSKDDRSDFEFEALAEVVVECGFGMRLLPMKSIWGQHNSIIHASMDNDYVKTQKGISCGVSEVPTGDLVEQKILSRFPNLLIEKV